MVAFLSLLMTVEGGFQGALMAPTEILATQLHAELADELAKITHPDGRMLVVDFLGGKTRIKEKRRISQPGAGYPMAYWCEFKPAYGFHEGFVWSEPRTMGCIRLHREAAARLYALVKIGTPVNIATSQPEDKQYGHFVRKLDQRNDPNPPQELLMSPRWFQDPPGPLLVKQ